MPAQYIFTIESLSKSYNKKEVLRNIWLAFYPGAKIGVLGGNGSGKSTLLRIMAGEDRDFLGAARPAPGTTMGVGDDVSVVLEIEFTGPPLSR